MKITNILFLFLLFMQLLHSQDKDINTKNLEFYREYRVDYSDSLPDRSPILFKIDYSNSQYAIQNSAYGMMTSGGITNSTVDIIVIEGDTLSTGKIVVENDTAMCVEDITNTVVLSFKLLDEFRIQTIKSIRFYQDNDVLYLHRIVGNNWKEVASWKDKVIFHRTIVCKEGFSSIKYEDGIAKDSIFKTWKNKNE